MDQAAIFGLQFLLSLIVYALIARWYVAPWLAGKPVEQALAALILPHAFRHLGLVFLVPGMLAIVALVVLRGGWGGWRCRGCGSSTSLAAWIFCTRCFEA